jgi:hypothetical protein
LAELLRCDFVAPFRDVTIFVTFVGQVSKIVSEGDLVTIFVSLGFSKGMTGTGERWRVLQMSYGNREYLRSVGGALAERWRVLKGATKSHLIEYPNWSPFHTLRRKVYRRVENWLIYV